MRHRLVLLSVSVSIFSVISSCAPTSSCEELLEVVQAGKHPAPDNECKSDMDKYNHLTTDSTVADVVNNPSFKGFGQYILPLEWRYDPDMKLRNISSSVSQLCRCRPRSRVHKLYDRHGESGR